MAIDPLMTGDGRLALTDVEVTALQDMLDAHDRGGFYMAYNAMTDSNEAALQSRIATFTGPVGGVAFVSNRIVQSWIGPGTSNPIYPGIYNLSQTVAQSALNFITERLSTDGGKIDDDRFFDSADKAWLDKGVHNYFPGNLLTLGNTAASTVATAIINALSALVANAATGTIADFRAVMATAISNAEQSVTSLLPGAFASVPWHATDSASTYH